MEVIVKKEFVIKGKGKPLSELYEKDNYKKTRKCT